MDKKKIIKLVHNIIKQLADEICELYNTKDYDPVFFKNKALKIKELVIMIEE